MKILLLFTVLALLCTTSTNAEEWGTSFDKSWVRYQYPQDEEKWWWQDDWWEHGKIDIPRNHDVVMEEISYQNGDVEVPAYLFRPKDDMKYPGVLFQHGRRGLDELTLLHPRRLAARGFVVLAPDLWAARFIGKYPMEHDYEVEKDAARGIEVLLVNEYVSSKQVCTVSHTRGGYITLKALVTYGKQDEQVACWVSYYPHLQDPNAVEPMQIYQYAPEAENLRVPSLIFFGEHEQYQRHRPITTIYRILKSKGRDVRLIIYPGVGRGFDFRPPNVRTLADDLAAKDAMIRTAQFIRRHLGQD